MQILYFILNPYIRWNKHDKNKKSRRSIHNAIIPLIKGIKLTIIIQK